MNALYRSFEGHAIAAQHLRTGDGGGARGGEGAFGIAVFHILRDGREGFTEAHAMRVRACELSLEAAIAEFLMRRDRLRRAQGLGRAEEPAARVLRLRRAAALDARAGEGKLEEGRGE